MENKVELLDISGDDFSIARAAWASTNKEITEEDISRIPKLLKSLREGSSGNAHTSPFEHNFISFRVTADIATHIHFIKHRIAHSVNTESARYRELREDKYYLPEDWPVIEKERLQKFIENAFTEYHNCIARLIAAGFSRARAKESARYYLPYGIQLNWVSSWNLLSFLNFIRLRAKDSAQVEVRTISREMLRLVKDSGKFDAALSAWGY